jgi:transposase
MARHKTQRGNRRVSDLERINKDTAGVDIGAEVHYVSVPEDRDPEPVRHFATFTADLNALADWLEQCRIKSVAMESTGVYWIPLYQILEQRGFTVCLVNTRTIGVEQKSDVQDCQWIRQLHSYGLLKPSFRPEEDICRLRGYVRQRQMLIDYVSAHIQHMQKAMTQMNLQLHHTISDITGVSGMRIIRAVVEGESDPMKLAALADSRVKNPTEVIAKSLHGDYRREHLFALKQALELYDFYKSKISECDQQIEAQLKAMKTKFDGEMERAKPSRRRYRPGHTLEFDAKPLLHRISGVDLTQVDGIDVNAAQTLLSEIGLDMNRWPSEKHFASWLGLCPNHRITGGKIQQRGTRKVVNRATVTLRMSAQSLLTSKSGIGAFARKMKSRLGVASAITATAHKLAKIIYRLLKFGEAYVDKGEQAYEDAHRARHLKNLGKQASSLGFRLVPIEDVS